VKSEQEAVDERKEVNEEVFVSVLQQAVRTIEDAGIPYAVIGGIPSVVLGRPRWGPKEDIDFFVKPEDARKTLEVLDKAGFETEERDPQWLYKAKKDGVVVDVIFRSSGDFYLDDEMIRRSFVGEFKGLKLQMLAAEDLVVMKALAHKEDTPQYWHDALSIIARSELDWDYLLHRAPAGPRRVLSLLLYAQSNDLAVPDRVIRSLSDAIYEFGDR
jgi:predicted nucleotidyltransferase